MSRELILKSFPKLREDMIAELPDQVVTYFRRRDYSTYRGPEHTYVFRYADRALPRLPGTWIVHLFVPDSVLEKRVWSRLRKFVAELKSANVYAVAGVSFTMWINDPLPVQLYNLWRIRFVERYLQDNGIRVLPCLDGNLYILDYILHTLPKDIPSASTDAQMEAKSRDRLGLMRAAAYTRAVVSAVRPRKLLVCGAEGAKAIAHVMNSLGNYRPQVLTVEFGREYREYLAYRRKEILSKKHWGGVPAES